MKKFLTFYIGGELLGIDVSLVKEITRNIEYTPLLNGKKNIKGLMNLRGNIVTIFDLEQILGKKTGNEFSNSQCIVLKTKSNEQLGFLVDKTGDVIEVKKESFCELPEDIIEAKNSFISSVIKDKDQLLKIVDFSKIVQGEDF